jgi:hypothetical protein
MKPVLPLVVLALLPSVLRAEEEQDLADALDKLAKLERVEGAAVGAAGDPGRFFLLSRVLLAKGNRSLFEKLVADRRPVSRAMGLFCLVHTDARKAVPVLRRHLADAGGFEYAPGGCLYWRSSVGVFARDLLRNTRCIEFEPPEPLVDARGRLALDVEVLARDDCSHVHEAAAGALAENPPPFKLAELRRLCPDLETWQLVKAIGRLQPHARWRDFLIGCLGDDELGANVRKAAASALTRDPDPRALAALKRHADDRFVRAAELCRRHADLMAAVRAERTSAGLEKIKATVIEAFTIDHPMALDDLRRSFGLAIAEDHEDVRRAVADSLLRIASRHKEFGEPWDTFSDLPARLERLLRLDADWRALLRPEEKAAIRAKLLE